VAAVKQQHKLLTSTLQHVRVVTHVLVIMESGHTHAVAANRCMLQY
jgi:hypothetical protein